MLLKELDINKLRCLYEQDTGQKLLIMDMTNSLIYIAKSLYKAPYHGLLQRLSRFNDVCETLPEPIGRRLSTAVQQGTKAITRNPPRNLPESLKVLSDIGRNLLRKIQDILQRTNHPKAQKCAHVIQKLVDHTDQIPVDKKLVEVYSLQERPNIWGLLLRVSWRVLVIFFKIVLVVLSLILALIAYTILPPQFKKVAVSAILFFIAYKVFFGVLKSKKPTIQESYIYIRVSADD